jgi:hypothetical protein
MVSKKSQKRKVVSRKTTKKRPLMKKKTSRKMSKKRRVVKKSSSRKKTKKRRVVKKRSTRKKRKKVIMRGGKDPLMSTSTAIEKFITDNFDQTYNLHKLLPGLITYNFEIIKDSSFKHAEILGMVTLIPDSWEDFKDIKKHNKAATSPPLKIKPEDYYRKKYFIIVKNPTGRNEKYEIEYLNNDQSFRITKFEDGKNKYFNGSKFQDGIKTLAFINLDFFFSYICTKLLTPYNEKIASSIKNNIKNPISLYDTIETAIEGAKALSSITPAPEAPLSVPPSEKPYVVIFDFDYCLMKGDWTSIWRNLKTNNELSSLPIPGDKSGFEIKLKSGEIIQFNNDFGFVTEGTVDKTTQVKDFFSELNNKAYIYIASYGYYECIETVLKKVLGGSFVDDYIKILTPELYKKPGTDTYYEGGTDLEDNKEEILTDILKEMEKKMEDIKKENCVFFDDDENNVETANKLGIIGRQDAPFSNERKNELLTLINPNENLDRLIL